jgi:hypothetical protein
MSLLKECVRENRLSMDRDKCRHPLKPLGRAGGVISSEIKQNGPLVTRLTFVEDFTREHSSRALHIDSIEISGIF